MREFGKYHLIISTGDLLKVTEVLKVVVRQEPWRIALDHRVNLVHSINLTLDRK